MKILYICCLSKQIHDEKQPKGQKGPTSLSKATKPKLRATRPQVKIKVRISN